MKVGPELRNFPVPRTSRTFARMSGSPRASRPSHILRASRTAPVAKLELADGRRDPPAWLRRPPTAELRIALVVPDYRTSDRGVYDKAALRADITGGSVDLVVFPEHFLQAHLRDAAPAVDALAHDLGAPVLTGVWVDDAYQTAFYANPYAGERDTRSHFYFKHSTSVKTAYDWPGYRLHRDRMFEPIRLGDARIGVHLCHDMFFGLVPARLRAGGATTLINLTGGDVNLAKWRNIVRGRSIEHRCLFLCTMAKARTDGRGAAAALAFDRGRPLLPSGDGRTPAPGRHVVFGTRAGTLDPGDASRTQAFSPRAYDDIKIGLGARPQRGLDVVVTASHGALHVAGGRRVAGQPGWTAFTTACGSLGVATLPMSALTDPYAVHRLEPRSAVFDHHLLVYGGGNEPTHDEVIALLRLRAIEHRMACGYLGVHGRELIKTSRYKNIQRLRHVAGVFGLDGMWMGGTFASASDASSALGIPPAHISAYRELGPT